MSYQVLARKWRPGNFDELVGQKQTSQALINALESQRLHHAYLFTGTRGVGKTTIARILSKSLNCEKGITSTPCGECASCVEITQGNFVDLIEIDAASKTKVEDTREMLDNVQYRPTRGRYKVYLIDEVHMLSGHSFNALLKTLEEPPPHVIFLLATTDPQKMPVTVLSRCLQFHLRHMEVDEIINHLSKILGAENIEFEEGALEPIAKGADGSMRDALSLLDQAIAFCGESINKATVLEMLGSIDRAHAYEILNAICANDAAQLMKAIERIAEFAPDYDELMADWLSMLHQIAVSQATGLVNDEKVEQLANQISPADLQLFYQLSLHARRDLAYAPHPRQGFEMAMLRVLAFKPQVINSQPPPSKKKVSINQQATNTNTNTNTISSLATAEINHTEQNRAVMASSSNQSMKVINGGSAQHSVNTIRSEIISEPAPAQMLAPQLKVVVDNELSNKSKDDTRIRKERAVTTNESSEKLLDNQRNKSEFHDSNSIESNYLKIAINEITTDNWFNVVGSLALTGQGLQVMLNSSAVYENNILVVNYLEKIEILLTANAEARVVNELQSYFSVEKLKVEFNIVTSTAGETPRERQTRLFNAAIDKAQNKLLSDPQMNYLVEHLQATLPRESIKILK
jgi:DNA polymerase III subunit gamma/tau